MPTDSTKTCGLHRRDSGHISPGSNRVGGSHGPRELWFLRKLREAGMEIVGTESFSYTKGKMTSGRPIRDPLTRYWKKETIEPCSARRRAGYPSIFSPRTTKKLRGPIAGLPALKVARW